jgi:hypothetical protein
MSNKFFLTLCGVKCLKGGVRSIFKKGIIMKKILVSSMLCFLAPVSLYANNSRLLCLADVAHSAKSIKMENGVVTKNENKRSAVADNMLVPFAASAFKAEVLRRDVNIEIARDAKGDLLKCSQITKTENEVLIPYIYEYKVSTENLKYISSSEVQVGFLMLAYWDENCRVVFSGMANANRSSSQTVSSAEGKAVAKIMTSSVFDGKDYVVQTKNCR